MSTRTGHSFDLVLLIVVGVLVVFGLLMLASAGSAVGLNRFGDAYYFVKHQVVFGLLPGLIGLIVFSRVPYAFWKRSAFWLFLISLGLLVLTFIPGLSAGIGTAHSWVSVGGWFSFQPSEFVKLTFLFYLAAWLERQANAGSLRDMVSGLVPFLISLGAVLGLLILQPDIGTMCIIGFQALAVYFVAGAPLPYVFGMVAAGAGSIALLIKAAPYRAARLMTFLKPELDPKGVGYHINQALLAIGSGGVFGLGYGHSRQKFQYLPEVVGDSVFAIVGEELGLIACLAVIGLFLILFHRLVKIGKAAPDPFGLYVCVGIAAWLVGQAFVNIGSMVAVMPMTGITLPFVSYGGTSLAVTLCAIGVVLNISRERKAP